MQPMTEAESAANFGTTLKSVGALLAWVGTIAGVVILIANAKTHSPYLHYGLPAIVVAAGLVVGMELRTAGYALRLTAQRAGVPIDSVTTSTSAVS